MLLTLDHQIYSMDFTPDGNSFVTAGDKHFKFWELLDGSGALKKTEKAYKGKMVLEGCSVGVPEKFKVPLAPPFRLLFLSPSPSDLDSPSQDKFMSTKFMDLAVMPSGHVYSVTGDGYLVLVESGAKRIDKIVHMKANSASSLSLTPQVGLPPSPPHSDSGSGGLHWL